MKPLLNLIVFSVLLMLSPRLAAYDIKLYPASEVFDLDVEFFHERLGVNGHEMRVEEFEDDQIASWLTTNVKGGDNKTAESSWVGQTASTPVDSAEFQIQLPNARVFGIGIGNDRGAGERLSINGNTPIELNRFPGFEGNGGGRAYYLLILATPNDADVRSIVIDHGMTLAFDHLIVLQSKEPPTAQCLPPRLAVRLNDDRHFTALALVDKIAVLTETEKLDVDLERIYMARFQCGGSKVTIFLRTGEKLSGELQTSQLNVSTKEGEISVPTEQIRELKVTPRGEFNPADARSERLNYLIHPAEPLGKG